MPKAETYKRWSRRPNLTQASSQWSDIEAKADPHPGWVWTPRTYQDQCLPRERSVPHRPQHTRSCRAARRRPRRSATRAVLLPRRRRPRLAAGLQWACSPAWPPSHGASLGTAVLKPPLQTHSLLLIVQTPCRSNELPATGTALETFSSQSTRASPSLVPSSEVWTTTSTK